MAERLSAEQYERICRLHNAMVKEQQGDSGLELIAMDPYTGTEISPVTPPECLMRDERLAQGYLFLIDNGHRLRLDVLLNAHGKAEDLGETLDFERKIADSNIVLLEGLGWDETLFRELNSLSSSGRMNRRVYEDYYEGNTFQERMVNAIAHSGAVISFNDIDAGSGIREDMIALADLPSLLKDTNLSDREKRIKTTIHIIAYESLREWFMIGQIGYQLKRIMEQAGADIAELSKQKITVTLGTTHTGIVDKLRVFDVDARESVSGKLNRANKLVAESIKIGRANIDEIESL